MPSSSRQKKTSKTLSPPKHTQQVKLPPRSDLHRPMTSLPTPSLLMVTYSLLVMAVRTSGDDDQVCLTHLYQSLQDPLNRLTNWTPPTFSSPCTGFTSHLYGATCNNGRVYKLSLSNLSLRGTIPPNLSLCTSLQSLDLSSNRLSGPIPPDLHSLLNLALLNLSSNFLSGPIPPDLALCAYLNVIDLHSNLLSGTIPPQLGLLSRLSVFDVSYNRLEGEIPSSIGNRSGLAVRFNASSFEGNKGLYGYPLGEGRGGATGGLSVMMIVGIGLGSGLASLIISFVGVCIWLRVMEQRMAMEEGKIAHLMPEY